MELRLPLNHTRHITLISASAPILASSDEVKEAVYEEPHMLVKITTESDELLLLGDFGTDY
jgi:hypothetical protein